MKFFILILMFASSSAFAVTTYKTVCKDNDCFRNGWITTAPDYVLDTECKGNDCKKFGWFSVANDNSTYDITCKDSGCFTKGWNSVQAIDNKLLKDDVTCVLGSCLTVGWTVATGYDMMGGSTMCYLNDCSKYGGGSYWRGHPTFTACYNNDCYHEGWDWLVY